MHLLIIEDEPPAACWLTSLVQKLRPSWYVLKVIDTVQEAVSWLETYPAPNLIFLDIQLADGISFDIFKQVSVQTPIIFTTAFDEYTLKAFKLNSIDYLLKPISEDDLSVALDKFDTLSKPEQPIQESIHQLVQQLATHRPTFRERLVVKLGQQLIFLETDKLAYCYVDQGLTVGVDLSGKKWPLDQTLDQLEEAIDPRQFFRLNRKLLVRLRAIQTIYLYFNSRLKLNLEPPPPFDVIVSRERVVDFKAWFSK